jgi:methionine sulfoxide reductase heme-binding subunit
MANLQGWRLTIGISLLLTLICAGIVWQGMGSVDSVRAVLRFTARTSLVLFCLAYAASALVKLWKQPWTLWLRRNRRYIGVSFGASHFLHALAIAAFAWLDPVLFGSVTSPGTFVSAGIAYIFIALMTATSFDRTARAIGPKAWAALHGFGSLYIAITFLIANGMRITMNAWYALPALLIAGVLLLRFVARRPAAKPA